MRGRYKKWAPAFLGSHEELVLKKLDPLDPFLKSSSLALEIGSGKGDFVIGMARKHPDANFLAIERDLSICGILAKKVAESEVHNIRIINGDFDHLAMDLTPFLFQTIFLNFSDPWPKKRHEKRRLTTKGRLTSMAKLLSDKGTINIKTDNDSFYEFTMAEAPLDVLSCLVNDKKYEFDENNDVMSEYEKNFRLAGKDIHRLVYQRIK